MLSFKSYSVVLLYYKAILGFWNIFWSQRQSRKIYNIGDGEGTNIFIYKAERISKTDTSVMSEWEK